ncbi:MAG: ATP-dependent helicase [Candidatus Anstonellales archaeon]
MISRLGKAYSDHYIYSLLEESVATWFKKAFGSFTEPQRYAIAEIHKKENVLISAPTGSGKTLSAFLAIINELFALSQEKRLENQVYCIYVSPLRALSNDIKKNLLDVFEDIKAQALLMGKKEAEEIRIGVRTSDTTQYERSKMSKKAPHILITTPESLGIILNSPVFSQRLRGTKYVIIDEIHALAGNKRGTHLAVSLERLALIADFVRIGLSATVSPLEEVARFLVGSGRSCKIVDTSSLKKVEISVETPVDDFIASSSKEITESMYSLMERVIKEGRTTLVFTNTRSATERVAYFLKQKLSMDEVQAHHSSLSREHRLEVESMLKKGETKVVVSSTSLELGIDIGAVDSVVLITSPKSTSRALQRVGRSGHSMSRVAKGIMIALDNDDLMECAAIKIKADQKDIDKVRIIEKPYDVLIQHLFGMSIERKWKAEEALQVFKRAYPYRSLTMEELEKALLYLSGFFSELENKKVFAKVWFENGEFGRRGRLARLIYYSNSGTIPDETGIKVFSESSRYIGKIEEAFLERLAEGDRFVLGGKVYEFISSSGSRVLVRESSGNPTVPAWYSEMLPLSYETALFIEELREELSSSKDPYSILQNKYRLSKRASKALSKYIEEQKLAWCPSRSKFFIEHYSTENMYIFHACAGRKANDALARAIAYRIGRKKKCNIALSVLDHGFVLTLPKGIILSKEDISSSLYPDFFESDVRSSIKNSEVLKRRFRHVALRSFLVLRSYKGIDIGIDKQQINAENLLKFLERNYKDFPVLDEAYREVLYDYMHIDEALDYMGRMAEKELVLISTSSPSPFSFNLIVSGTSDIVLMESRHEYIKKLYARFMEGASNAGKRKGANP